MAGPKTDPFSTNAAQVIARLLQNPQAVSNVQLQWLRNQYPANDYMQGILAPYEHQAFAREAASEGPGGAAAMTVAVPAYAAAKGLGIVGGRSGSDALTQILAGLQGAGQGFTQWLQSKGARPMWADNPPQQPPTWITGVRG